MCDVSELSKAPIFGIRLNDTSVKRNHEGSLETLRSASPSIISTPENKHELESNNANDNTSIDSDSNSSPSANGSPFKPKTEPKLIIIANDSTINNSTGKEMAPVLGVPPPPPPAPHMGPDGLILPRKPYNPCLISDNHKDLRRELLFNQKIGKNVLNQKSELQRALERHREMVSRKEAERNQEEMLKNDPRTALQRAIEQRAKHIELSQQPQHTEPPNPLVTARARLRSRTDSQ